MPTIRTRAAKGSELSHNELDANFTRPVQQKTTAYTTVVGDNRSLIECNHASTPFTITLGVATDMDASEPGDYIVWIKNINAAIVTVARSSTDTIDGATSITLEQYEGVILQVNSAGTGYNIVSREGPTSGGSIQQVNAQTGAVDTSTTQIPFDDTKPQQSTEGKLISALNVTITPKNTNNRLHFSGQIHLANSLAAYATAAIYQDSTEDAIAVFKTYDDLNVIHTVPIDHWMTAGTTSATTFKVHYGPSTSVTTTLNGVSGARRYGGVLISTLTVKEYKA